MAEVMLAYQFYDLIVMVYPELRTCVAVDSDMWSSKSAWFIRCLVMNKLPCNE